MGIQMFEALRKYSPVVLLFCHLVGGLPDLFALNPNKLLSQYRRTDWTEAQGLPQDAIRTLAQTSDGYLWLGTDEGLVRFDGYDFRIFTKDNSPLPSTSIMKLATATDGGLWIGTSRGLIRYKDNRFKTYTTKDGLPSNIITSLSEDTDGSLWMVAGVILTHLDRGKLTSYPMDRCRPIKAVRVVYEDPKGTLWVGGDGGIGKIVNSQFVPVLGPSELLDMSILGMARDRGGSLWIAGSLGVFVLHPDGRLEHYDTRNGLQERSVRTILEDRDGNIWAGTYSGISRFSGSRFVPMAINGNRDLDWVRCLLEDREGNIWLGMNSGLIRLHDELFTTYGRSEGFPSDTPIAVHQDRRGDLWVGYHSEGLISFNNGRVRHYTVDDGLANNNIIAIRESHGGDLLVSTTGGLNRMHDGHFSRFIVPDPLARRVVFDALEDRDGRIWAATSSGIYKMVESEFHNVAPGGPLLNDSMVVLTEGLEGRIWGGSYGRGLWSIKDGVTRQYTTSDGLSSDQIRSLYQDSDGTLWIGTLGGGLNDFRNGAFTHYTAKDGLLSDNISHIDDDGRGSLWLSTPRGICRISKQQLSDFKTGRIRSLSAVNYGVEDGLRSAQLTPGYPGGSGGARTTDGHLWFPTTRGLATIDPGAPEPDDGPAPVPRIVEVSADGQNIDLSKAHQFKAGTAYIQFRFVSVHLSRPESVRYAYKLDGLSAEWISTGSRRDVIYNSLAHGKYTFHVQTRLRGQAAQEASFNFEVLPHFYETSVFIWVCIVSLMAAIYGIYQLRLRQIHGRFLLVTNERTRLAREIHDTLAQALVGIASQLDALAFKLDEPAVMLQHLNLARKMARHSLSEARRSVLNLRTTALEDQDLCSALASGVRQWVDGTPVHVRLNITGQRRKLQDDVEQNVLRIAQEAVMNAIMHGKPEILDVELAIEASRLRLRIKDDGPGFETSASFPASSGHFGITGMRERAQRIGGRLSILSRIGEGTEVEVQVPI